MVLEPVETQSKPQSKRLYGKTRLYIRGIERDPLVQLFVEKIQDVMPEIADDRFYVTLYAWCELEIVALRSYAALKDGVTNDQTGDSRRLVNDWRQLRSTQLAFSRELGLTPASLASIRAILNQSNGRDGLADTATTRLAVLDVSDATAPAATQPRFAAALTSPPSSPWPLAISLCAISA
jgi:hypothetical protein